jgi:hypothetical protein
MGLVYRAGAGKENRPDFQPFPFLLGSKRFAKLAFRLKNKPALRNCVFLNHLGLIELFSNSKGETRQRIQELS